MAHKTIQKADVVLISELNLWGSCLVIDQSREVKVIPDLCWGVRIFNLLHSPKF